jgi:hypothetical protein
MWFPQQCMISTAYHYEDGDNISELIQMFGKPDSDNMSTHMSQSENLWMSLSFKWNL